MTDATETSRRSLLGWLARVLTGLTGWAILTRLVWPERSTEPPPSRWVWQIDPDKCIQSRKASPGTCGRCQTECVLSTSAVKCVHAYAVCGYCELCSGYFASDPPELTTAAENQLCPTGAIERSFIEDPYYEYAIDETLCVACGKCVTGCNAFGNGSLYLQVRHDRCLNCNECAIAQACPAGAFVRVPADDPYLLRDPRPTGEGVQ